MEVPGQEFRNEPATTARGAVAVTTVAAIKSGI